MKATMEETFRKAAEFFAQGKKKQPQQDCQPQPENRVDVAKYLDRYGKPFKIKQNGSGTIYSLETCPFDNSHVNASSVIQQSNGMLLFQCFHNSCQGHTFREAREIISGKDSLRPFMDGNSYPKEETPDETNLINLGPLRGNAQSAFPYKRSFPWEIFPLAVADSLLACAESCATSPTALAGTASAIMASVLGRTVSISPKTSWVEPLHGWFADIRPSGEGKTPPMQLLAHPLHQAQAKSDADFEMAKEIWAQSDKKTRGAEPKWSRSYFASGLTLEGVRAALQEGHGGLVCLLNEISSFITGQGQYKSGKGDDREAWLALHDGSPSRILRAGNSLTIPASRVSICGGIQPEVFRSVFGDKNGLFLADGTIFRFLVTYERSGHYELTRSTWSNQHRAVWEKIVNQSMKWADARFGLGGDPLILRLDDDAWHSFSEFRNSTFSKRDNYPLAFRGFVPKAVSYVLRLAGLLHVIEQLSNGVEVHQVVGLKTIKSAITAVQFYLGHTLEALKLLHGEQTTIQQSDEKKHIGSVLEGLFEKAEGQGYVTVGDITKGYNSMTGKNETPHHVGDVLRGIGLNPKKDSHRGTYEIRKEEMRIFLKTMSAKSACPQNAENKSLFLADINNQSPQSPINVSEGIANPRTLLTYDKQSSQEETSCFPILADLANIADIESKQSEKTELFKVKKSGLGVVA